MTEYDDYEITAEDHDAEFEDLQDEIFDDDDDKC